MTKEEFTLLADQWQKETYFHSNISIILRNDNYEQILLEGETNEMIVPWILEYMDISGGFWFTALRQLTGSGPVIEENERGRITIIRNKWLDWGEENNIYERQRK